MSAAAALLILAAGLALYGLWRKYEAKLRWLVPLVLAGALAAGVVLYVVARVLVTVLSMDALTWSFGLGGPVGVGHGWVVRIVRWCLVTELAVTVLVAIRRLRSEQVGWLEAHWELLCLFGAGVAAAGRFAWAALNGDLATRWTTLDGAPIPIDDPDYAQFFSGVRRAEVIEGRFTSDEKAFEDGDVEPFAS